jgi:quinol monooxygenase YgiN
VIGKRGRLTEAIGGCNYGEGTVIIVMGYLQLSQGGADRLQSAIAPMIAKTRAENGCEHYTVAIDVADADRLHVAERWIDQTALGAHLVSDHVVDFQLAMRRTKILEADVNIYHPDGTVKRLINV